MDANGAAETFWERYLAQYRFRRLFGKESRWRSLWSAIVVAWNGAQKENPGM
jgi:hypothetical protein